MTVSSTSSRVVYDGNGVTTAWPFAFKIKSSADIVVIYTDADGVDTTLSYGSQYTATGFDSDAGGTVTYPTSGSPIALGTTLTIYRSVSPTQPTSISNQGAMWPAVIEAALDRLTYIVQGFLDSAARSIKAPVTDGTSLDTLPVAADRANGFLAFDADGQPMIASGATSVPVSAAMSPVVQAASLGAARTAMGVPGLGDNNAFTGNNTHSGIVTMTGKPINQAQGADIASATTTDIGAATGNHVNITGTTTITALGTVQAGTRRTVKFAGILTLTYNATSLILPTAASITTAAGDTAEFVSLGSGNWICILYQRASGVALAPVISGATTFLAADVNLNNTSNWFSGPNTGSIGASGQVWLISAFATMIDTAGIAQFELGIFNGSTYLTDLANTSAGASAYLSMASAVVVTLSGATTFTARARDNSSTSGVLKTTGAGNGASNVATSITAIRIS